MSSKVTKALRKIITNCISYPLEDVNAILEQMEDEFRDIVKEYKMEQKLTIDRVKDIIRHVLSNDDVLTYVVESMNKEKESKKCHSVVSENLVTSVDDGSDELTEDGELMDTPTKQSPVKQKIRLITSVPKNVTKPVDVEKRKISKSIRISSHNIKSRYSPYKHRPHWRTHRSPFKGRLDVGREASRYKSRYSSPRKVFPKASAARHLDDRHMLESQEAQRKMYESRERGRLRSPYRSHCDKGYGEFRDRHDHTQSKSVKRVNSASHEKTQEEEDRFRIPKKLKVPEKVPKHQDKILPKTNSLEKSEQVSTELNVTEVKPVNAVVTQKHESMLLTMAQKSVARFEAKNKLQNDIVKDNETAVSSSEPAKADSETLVSTKIKNGSKVDVPESFIESNVIHAESKDLSSDESSTTIETGSTKITPSEEKGESQNRNMAVINVTCNEITSGIDVDMNDEVLEIKISESEKLEESPVKEVRRSPRKKLKNEISAKIVLSPSSSIKNETNIPENNKPNVPENLNKEKVKKYVKLHCIETPKLFKKRKSLQKSPIAEASSNKKKTTDSVKVSLKCVNVDSKGKLHVSGSDVKKSEINADSEPSKKSCDTLKLHVESAVLHKNDNSAKVLQNSINTSISENESQSVKDVKSGEMKTCIESSEVKSPNKITKKSPSAMLQAHAKEIHEPAVTKNKEPVTKSKEPVTKSKEPVTKNKEPVTKNKELVTKDEEPVTKSKEPLTNSKEPVTKNKELVTKNEEPVTKSKEPVTKNKELVTKNEEPVTKSKEPVTKSKEPVTKSKEPVTSIPVIESTKEQNSPKKVELKWTREEDREILLTCRKYGSSQVSFQMAANASLNKTAEQVKERFFHLMEIYSKAMNKMSS